MTSRDETVLPALGIRDVPEANFGRGRDGFPLTDMDQELVQLKPLHRFRHSEYIAWMDDDNSLRYGSVIEDLRSGSEIVGNIQVGVESDSV